MRQGDPLSLLLFNLALEVAIRSIPTNPGGTIYNCMSQHLEYTNDVAIISKTQAALSGTFQEFEEAMAKLGLRVNENKTVYMKNLKMEKEIRTEIALRDHNFRSVDQFKYLGSLVTCNNKIESEINTRMLFHTAKRLEIHITL